VLYAGAGNTHNIALNNAKPLIQYNTIRLSSQSGVYANGNGCDTAQIRCNNITDNKYGVYAVTNAEPIINNNNLLRNTSYGIYNGTSTVTLNGENNWWGDLNGPNQTGDKTYGTVDYTPWLSAESNCVSGP
jgi:hypothetical protein